MKKRLVLAFILLGCIGLPPVTDIQSPFQAKTNASPQNKPALAFTEVIKQSLSDPELKDYDLVSSVMEVPAGFADSIKHRHDAELFGYVLEGSVEIQLEEKNIVTYEQGKMFYEPRNTVHSLLRNRNETKPAKVLLIFVIKKGRPSYTPVK